ncbi:Plasma membrane proteolipid 3 [Orchesella cincta]|uniref:Plasma membrane proteolipid 3 n=1 Tax=Orchesella cincta TaxID=48709 RepID=A0A1D2MC11_ORCCI|nr:Plasma membrane proteolipid 3 [Orchesella cincta]
MASRSEDPFNTLLQWEAMMACCFPFGLLWFKEGAGSPPCILNMLLSCFFGPCCLHSCHACSYVGEPAKEGSPCSAIATLGEISLPKIHGIPQRQKVWHLTLSTTNNMVTAEEICMIILALVFPPLGVFLAAGCGLDLCINILLTMLGFLPGVAHAFYVLIRENQADSSDRRR